MDKNRLPRSAIALQYDEKSAPRITAKGEAALADEIVARALEHGIPLHEDKQLAALLSQLKLGDEIPRELYIAVAEVLAFAYMLTGKLPREWREQQRDK
ncbi:MAG: EscU/YscU/HrcU family type III secretion system export apparatus switch protein [Gammaproteobacteria bacterium]|nr:EscU/YscU/HrcU family type III secretion system export apparatus switch protein [Gammaproteobacteria bacterium]